MSRETIRRRRPRLLVLGTLTAAGLTAVGFGLASSSGTAAQSQYAPRNESPPTISDTSPNEGQELTADPGRWTGPGPIVFAYQWVRCNSSGGSCVAIPRADDRTYTPVQADVGDTLRVRVTATNASGASADQSAATARVQEAVARPPSGTNAVNVQDLSLPVRLVVDDVKFTPTVVRSPQQPIQVRVHVRDTQGRSVSGALVFLRSTPLVTSSPAEQATGPDGWVTLTTTPQQDIRLIFKPGYNIQFFVRARKSGEDALAGVSTRRLVQVAIGAS
jgi:hypothetical protein